MTAPPMRGGRRVATLAAAAMLASVALATPATATAPDGPSAAEPAALPADAAAEPITVADTSELHTWWHDNAERNTEDQVADDAVRQSGFYEVTVATATEPDARYDSFVYMSLPRSGNEKRGYTTQDGAEYASAADLTMSWSSFEYAADVWVDVTLTTGQEITSADQITIRPQSLDFDKELVDGSTVRIKVPYADSGFRFSVEFDPQQMWSYSDSNGELTTSSEGNRRIHEEPQNSMLIFAEPRLSADLVPTEADGDIRYVEPGDVRDLNSITEEIVYFAPGTYSMGWNYHAELPEQVKWVYLAPGAYVKGAFRFPSDVQDTYKVTGYGVLSGEQYVYEADTREDYQHRSADSNCHEDCVKMLQFESKDEHQHLDLQGVTINEPPYHSFVVYGNETTFTMDVRNYKQVGSWYWQTDGIELYAGGTMNDTFFHANDDVLKIYHSDLSIENTVIWKNENGPVIQWGWREYTIDNVHVQDTHVIHNRMAWADEKYNTCILNSSSHWKDMDATNTAVPEAVISNMFFENITVEGATNCAVRIFALSSTENVLIKNLAIDEWNDLDPSAQVSRLKAYTNEAGEQVRIGNETTDGQGVKLWNYSVGGEYIVKDADGGNWRDHELGRLGFDGELWDSWNAWADGVVPEPTPEPSAEPSLDPEPSPSAQPGDDSSATTGPAAPDASAGDGTATGAEADGGSLPVTGAGGLAVIGAAALLALGAGALLLRRSRTVS